MNKKIVLLTMLLISFAVLQANDKPVYRTSVKNSSNQNICCYLSYGDPDNLNCDVGLTAAAAPSQKTELTIGA